MKDPFKMTVQGVDTGLANILGMKPIPICFADDHGLDDEHWCYTCAAPVNDQPMVPPRFHKDDNLMRKVRAEISKRGRIGDFVGEVLSAGNYDSDDLFSLIDAPTE